MPIYESPPTRGELARLAEAHGQGMQAFVGTRSRKFKELDLADKELSDDEWLDVIEREPRLLRRPILSAGKKVVVGWSEAEYEALLENDR